MAVLLAYYVLEISISVIHYTMPTKYCKWGTCKSFSKKDKTIKFFPFPKPCKDFRMLTADPTLIAIQHDADTCVQCSKCTAWIRACSTTKFSSLEQINRNCYVCYKHFPDGTPTEDQPIPICARSFSQVSNYYIQYIYRYITGADPGGPGGPGPPLDRMKLDPFCKGYDV